MPTRMHARTHARTRARAHTHTHARTHTHTHTHTRIQDESRRVFQGDCARGSAVLQVNGPGDTPRAPAEHAHLCRAPHTRAGGEGHLSEPVDGVHRHGAGAAGAHGIACVTGLLQPVTCL